MKKIVGNRGVTILELIVVMAIIGIAATIAVPSYIKMLPKIRLKHAAVDTASFLNLSRMEAISKNTSKTITFTQDGYSGNISGRDWYKKVIFHFPATGLKYTLPSLTSSKATFDWLGRYDNSPSTNTQEAVYLKSNDTSEEYRIVINKMTGRISIEYFAISTWKEK